MEGVNSRQILATFLLALASYPTATMAQPTDAMETITASVDIRLVGVDGERSWLNGDFGKARFDGSDGGNFRLRPQAAEASIAWRPQFTWSLSGTFVAVAQDGQQHGIDLSEAFLAFKPLTDGPLRISARAGLFWPPISLEHAGPNWSVTETITPSAINSWIGEEVKVVGAELTASIPLGAGRLSASTALFGFNDTSGALLAFRGWAIHDQRAVAFGKQPLPPLNAFMSRVQPRYTRPVIELDDRVGFYARLVWAPEAPVRLEVLHYDNRGDPETVNKSKQWGWRTRFNSIGAQIGVSPRLELRMQGVQGRAKMGYPSNGRIWVDTRFRAAYLLATRTIGDGSISGRLEAFGTRNHGSRLRTDDNEDGWAATLAARHSLWKHMTMLVELEHVRSSRNSRIRTITRPRQHQTIAQVALRIRL